MVACQLPKLNARVRFPLPAPTPTCRGHVEALERAAEAGTTVDILHMSAICGRLTAACASDSSRGISRPLGASVFWRPQASSHFRHSVAHQPPCSTSFGQRAFATTARSQIALVISLLLAAGRCGRLATYRQAKWARETQLFFTAKTEAGDGVNLVWTFTHNNFPMASFSNPREGWLAHLDTGSAELRIMITHDGSTWRRLRLNDAFISAIQYVGEGTGFAFSSDIYTHADRFWATKDGGRSWTYARLPTGFTVDQMRFANRRDGYLAGCLRQRLTILSTHDGGSSWTERTLASLPLKDLGNCALAFDGLSVVTPREAWLLASKHSFGPDDTAGLMKAWRTADGGRTWTVVYREAFIEDNEKGEWFSGPYALTAKLRVIFRNRWGGGSDVLVSSDEGRNWSSTPVSHPIAGCVRTKPGLTCAGGREAGFWLARITPKGRPD
jgi:hypothetical protein